MSAIGVRIRPGYAGPGQLECLRSTGPGQWLSRRHNYRHGGHGGASGASGVRRRPLLISAPVASIGNSEHDIDAE